MRISETFFINGRPVGRIVQDDFSGELASTAIEHHRRGPDATLATLRPRSGIPRISS
jgi:hypothetical protein